MSVRQITFRQYLEMPNWQRCSHWYEYHYIADKVEAHKDKMPREMYERFKRLAAEYGSELRAAYGIDGDGLPITKQVATNEC